MLMTFIDPWHKRAPPSEGASALPPPTALRRRRLAPVRSEVLLTQGAAPGPPLQCLSPRAFSWLGEHQDEAAELAALLHEAAPRLALAGIRTPLMGSGGRAQGLPKARSYEASDTIRDRLHAAVPMPTGGARQGWQGLCGQHPHAIRAAPGVQSRWLAKVATLAHTQAPAPAVPMPAAHSAASAGPGQVDWSCLTAIISSEMLQLDEASDAALLARLQSLPAGTGAATDAARPAAATAAAVQANGSAPGTRDSSFSAPAVPPAMLASPRPGGDMLEINSGGWRGRGRGVNRKCNARPSRPLHIVLPAAAGGCAIGSFTQG